MNLQKTQVIKNLKEKSVLIIRTFPAPVSLVWRAFTESEILDKWWGPAPWKAETKFQDFSEGGYWLYAMVGPENEKHWARMNYKTIVLNKSFTLEDCFCDENGKINTELPISKGGNHFSSTDEGTRVEFRMTYSTEEQLQQIIEMGFEQGITVGFEQLEQLIIHSRI